jgi:hypothetical protein
MIERNKYSFPGLQSAYGLRGRLKYRIHGNYLWLKPLPISGQVIRLWYVPRYMQLVNTTDVLDGFSGWEEYVVIDAAIKCLQKEESDVSVLLVQKAAFEKRLEEHHHDPRHRQSGHGGRCPALCSLGRAGILGLLRG